MLQLRFLNDNTPPMWLVAPTYTFGTSLDNDYTLEQAHVAPRHAKILVNGDAIALVRIDNTASTRVNGIEIREESPLKAGDTVTLGKAKLLIADPKTEQRREEKVASEQTVFRQSLGTVSDLSEEVTWHLRPLNTALANSDKYELSGNITIGRSKECDICIGASHLSRKHARFVILAGTLSLEDLKSSNGSFVNGNRINKIVLKHGDEIGFDTLRFRVESTQNLEDITTLRPALDQTQIRQALRDDHASGALQRKTQTVRPRKAQADEINAQASGSDGEPYETIKLVASALAVVAVVAGLAWFLLT